MTHWTDYIKGIIRTPDGRWYNTLADWWEEVRNGNDMLWLLSRLGYRNYRTLRLLAVRFVRETEVGGGRTAWDILNDDSRQAVIVAEQYANGEATAEQLSNARESAWGSVRLATTTSAAASASTAAWATVWSSADHAASSAAWGVVWAAAASNTSGYAAAQSQHAVIVHEMILFAEVQELYDRYITQKEVVR